MESEVIKKAKQGDRDAMAQIIRNNQENVFALAYRMTGSREDALDISQDVFVKAIKGIKKFKGKSAISTWLYSITANTCKDFLRKNKSHQDVELDNVFLRSQIESPIDNIEIKDRRRLVRDALESLPEGVRAAFILRYENELQIDDIAEALGKAPGTIKAQLHDAVKRLRKIIGVEV